MNNQITIRKAVKEDAMFMAERILWAIGIADAKDTDIEKLSTVCAMKDVLYSYDNTLIAEMDGKPAGIMISYNGALYSTLRVKTFSEVGHAMNCDLSNMADEAAAGEYYIDSLAVSHEFRHKGIGRALLTAAIEQGKALGIEKATLLVSPKNTHALRLYSSLGFKTTRMVHAFDHNYLHMELQLNNNQSKTNE